MIHAALHQLPLREFDVVFIENVGNLVCPASFDLGQHVNVTLLSVPEGDDKPQKYPVMFRTTDLMLLTKHDLLEYLPEFDPLRAQESLRSVGSAAPIINITCRSREPGVAGWCDWLVGQLDTQREHRACGGTRRPAIARDDMQFHPVT
jgi:hydrogenase nickel incorporation protein HypB